MGDSEEYEHKVRSYYPQPISYPEPPASVQNSYYAGAPVYQNPLPGQSPTYYDAYQPYASNYQQGNPQYGYDPQIHYVYYDHDPLCNSYWVLFIFGMFLFPPLLICGSFGLRSRMPNERKAGLVNFVGLIFYLVFLMILVVGGSAIDRRTHNEQVL